MAIWFTSDHHFGHANIIKFCSRPFATVEEMDEGLVRRWNATVGANDEVWHLGDFAYRCGPNRLLEIFGSLRGRSLHLVRGNHDRKRTTELPWASVQDYAEIRMDRRLIVLFHYGLREWNGRHHGAWSLYGHSHGRLSETASSCDVGVDAWEFRPVSLDEIAVRLAASPTFDCG